MFHIEYNTENGIWQGILSQMRIKLYYQIAIFFFCTSNTCFCFGGRYGKLFRKYFHFNGKVEKRMSEKLGIALDRTQYALYVGNKNFTDFLEWDGFGSSFIVKAEILSKKYGAEDVVWTVSDPEVLAVRVGSASAEICEGQAGADEVTAAACEGQTGAAEVTAAACGGQTGVTEATAEICARRTGVAVVTAALPDGEKASCCVTVIDNTSRMTVRTMEFQTDRLKLSAGMEAELRVILYPKDYFQNGILDSSVSWESSDESVAVVTNGRVKAVGNGCAVITAISKDVGRRAQCEVTVQDQVKKSEIRCVREETAALSVGEQVCLQAESDSRIIWRSENRYVADVDENGVVTGYSSSDRQVVSEDGFQVSYEPGTVTIYATAEDGGAAAKFEVCVAAAKTEVSFVKMNMHRKTLTQNGEICMTAVFGPSSRLLPEIQWTTSDSAVVEVTPAADTVYGARQVLVRACGCGSAVITASCGGKSDCCVVKVTAEPVKVGAVVLEPEKALDVDEVYRFAPQGTEDAQDGRLLWIGTDGEIATVDREGTVQGYRPGTITVYAVARDSLSEEKCAAVLALGEMRIVSEEAVRAVLDQTVWGSCRVTVRESSPCLRNLHVPVETVTDHSVSLLWNRASMLQAAELDHYEIWMNQEGRGTCLGETSALSYPVRNLKPETAYRFTVKAIGADQTVLCEQTVSAATKEKSQVLNVLDYGARGDDSTCDTFAIQRAINECPENGTVYLPKGHVFRSGALFLKSNMTFQVDGVLIGSDNPTDYPRIISRWEGWRSLNQADWPNAYPNMPYNIYARSSLINAGTYDEGNPGELPPYHLENLVICGCGQINANGFSLSYNEGPCGAIQEPDCKEYYHVTKVSPVKTSFLRGRAISTHNVKNLFVRDLLVAYSPAWSVHSIFCENATYEQVKVVTQGNGQIGMGTEDVRQLGHILNGDGIDPECCVHVNICQCYFTTGDDAVAVKSGRNKEGNEMDKPNAYIRITDCTSAGSLGGFGVGSENAGGTHDVLIQNIHVERSAMNGIWFKTLRWRGGLTQNIQIRDMEVDTANAIARFSFDHSKGGMTNVVNPADELPRLRNLTLENVKGRNTRKGFLFTGLEDSCMEQIRMEGCDGGGAPGILRHVKEFVCVDSCVEMEEER